MGYSEDQRADVIRMARQFMRPKEIRAELDPPKPSRRTINLWIEQARESGELPSRKQVVRQLMAEGKTKTAIAKEIRMSRSQVKRLALEVERDDPENLDVDDQALAFIISPDKFMGADFTRGDIFGRRLLEIGVAIIDKNQAATQGIAQNIESLFRTMRSCSDATRSATCRMIMARGIRAACSTSRGEHQQAMELLREVEGSALSLGCNGCVGDYSRRRAWAAGTWAYYGFAHLWKDAIVWIEKARDAYVATRGHDILGNGPANCQYAYGFILTNAGYPQQEVIAAAEQGVEMIDAGTSPKLQGLLAQNLAIALKDSQSREDLARGRAAVRSAVDALLGEVEGAQFSLQWCAGYLDARLGDVPNCVNALAEALELAKRQRRPVEAAAILADIAVLLPHEHEVASHIQNMALDHEVDFVPRWLGQPLLKGVLGLLEAATRGASAITAAAMALRRQAELESKATGAILAPSPA